LTSYAQDDRESIQSRFFAIIQRMELNQLETAALRLALARNDPAIQQCLEKFRTTLNEDELTRNLREAARITIQSTLDAEGYEIVDPQGDDDDEDDQDDEDDDVSLSSMSLE
jgi:hypothetical protein